MYFTLTKKNQTEKTRKSIKFYSIVYIQQTALSTAHLRYQFLEQFITN